MGNEQHIKPLKGANLPPVSNETKKSGEIDSLPRLETSKHENPKQNASRLFDRKWQDAQAKDLKNNLTNLVSKDAKVLKDAKNSASDLKNNLTNPASKDAKTGASEPKNNQALKSNAAMETSGDKKDLPVEANRNKTAKDFSGKESLKTNFTDNKNLQDVSNKNNLSDRHDSFSSRQPEQQKNLLNQTLNSLINTAKEHKNLEHFRDQPKEFWDNVRQMSEVRIVETFVKGRPEPRAVSRFAELLGQFEKQGVRLEKFLQALPANERNVFEARFQINKTFGANDLFIGRGIVIDRRGDFSVRVFLSANGKNIELSAHLILSLLGGKISNLSSNSRFFATGGDKNSPFPTDSHIALPNGKFDGGEMPLLETAQIFTGGQFLLNAKTAALLSLSLALYQNINQSLPLTDVAPEFLSPNQATAFVPKNSAPETVKSSNQNSLENGKTIDGALARRTNESNAAAALINGALLTMDKYRKSKKEASGIPASSNTENPRFGFSAGATGAMMGATAGCIVPLAQKSVGQILGFAASVVVGLTDSGLLALGANTLVSVITNGAQIFLSASNDNQKNLRPEAADKFLNPADSLNLFEDEMRRTISNRRLHTFLTS